MRVKSLAAALIAATMISSTATAVPLGRQREYRQALKLYQHGMYERARSIFESVPDDPLSEGYAVLCAIKMRSEDYPSMMEKYAARYPYTSLTGRIRFENARRLFDNQKYSEATRELARVSTGDLSDTELPEYLFKCGYADFASGKNQEALSFFTILEALPVSQYTAPGRYVSGVIKYNGSQFAEAEADFWKASADPRFEELTEFYILDCEFNQKNYQYAVREGEKIFDKAPAERKDRLARIISESSLILGDTEKAKSYYENVSRKDMNRKDYFYAGSVMYSSLDFHGAIDNFTKMSDRTDSLGQVANYQLAYSYIQTHNQVAAMEAFHDASLVDFDAEITEDAAFNYAKLAFDLNKDTNGFKDYIKRYSTKTKGEQIYGYMALAALVDHDYAGAVEAYDSIDELDPDMQNNYTKANFLRGEQLFSLGSYRDAAPFLRATAYYLPKSDRLNQFSRYWLAESYYRSGNYSEAEKTFTELYNASALDGSAEGALLPYNIAYSYFKQKDFGSAARWFDKYIAGADKTNREDAVNRRADCDFGRRDYKAAIDSYQKAIDAYSDPDNIYPYYQQAVAYGLSGDRNRKVSTLSRVKNASPDAPLYSEAYYELGRALMDLKDNQQAIEAFKHLAATTKDHTYAVRSLIGQGMASRNMADYDYALECYQQVVSEMPGSEYAEEALLAIASIYQTKRQPQKYLEYLEKNNLTGTKSEAEKEKMYFNTAEQLYLAGNYSEAISSLQKFLDNYPDHADCLQARFYLAESYRANGEKEQAVDWYAKVKDLESDHSFVEMSKLRYADLSYELNRFQDAQKGYLSLMSNTRIDANRTAARIGLMRSAFRAKDYAAALSAAEGVGSDKTLSDDLVREALYVKAKSLLASSRRADALKVFKSLAEDPSTVEGAEAGFMLIQDLNDTGRFAEVEDAVYSFSEKASQQSYWLAKAFIALGDSYAEQAKYEKAKATFESVRDGYQPSGAADDVMDNVNMRLERLAILMQK